MVKTMLIAALIVIPIVIKLMTDIKTDWRLILLPAFLTTSWLIFKSVRAIIKHEKEISKWD